MIQLSSAMTNFAISPEKTLIWAELPFFRGKPRHQISTLESILSLKVSSMVMLPDTHFPHFPETWLQRERILETEPLAVNYSILGEPLGMFPHMWNGDYSNSAWDRMSTNVNARRQVKQGYRDGLLVQSTCSSYGGPRLSSQHLHGSLTMCNSSPRKAYWTLWSPAHTCCTCIHSGTHTHIQKLNIFKEPVHVGSKLSKRCLRRLWGRRALLWWNNRVESRALLQGHQSLS